MEKQTKLSTSQNIENKNDDTYLNQACIHHSVKKVRICRIYKRRETIIQDTLVCAMAAGTKRNSIRTFFFLMEAICFESNTLQDPQLVWKSERKKEGEDCKLGYSPQQPQSQRSRDRIPQLTTSLNFSRPFLGFMILMYSLFQSSVNRQKIASQRSKSMQGNSFRQSSERACNAFPGKKLTSSSRSLKNSMSLDDVYLDRSRHFG